MAEPIRSQRYDRAVSGALAVLGLAVLALAGYSLYQSAKLIFTGTRTEGIVSELIEVHDSAGGTRGFAPLVSYSDATGNNHLYRSPSPENPTRFDVGNRVAIYFDPADPDTAVIKGFRETFAAPLLIAMAGSFLMLLAGIIAASPRPARQSEAPPPSEKSQPAAKTLPESAALLQFHPFNPVAYAHYLSGLKAPPKDRKVKITDAAAALAEGRNPVVLAEFLSYMLAIAGSKDPLATIKADCPHLTKPHVFGLRAMQGLAFLFEGTAFIVMAGPKRESTWYRLRNLTGLRTGRRQSVPGDTVWDAAPRHRGFAEDWDAVRDSVEGWAKDAVLQSDQPPPFILAGYSNGGALACLAAYEFVKRGRSISCVITFGAPRPGGRSFAHEYDRLGLDERTLRIESDAAPDGITQLPLIYAPVGRAWRLDHKPLLSRDALPDGRGGRETGTVSAPPDLLYRYSLPLTALVYQRLREITGAGGTKAQYGACYTSLGDHLAAVRGSRPDNPGDVFASLKDLPVKVLDTDDLETLKARYPEYLI